MGEESLNEGGVRDVTFLTFSLFVLEVSTSLEIGTSTTGFSQRRSFLAATRAPFPDMEIIQSFICTQRQKHTN